MVGLQDVVVPILLPPPPYPPFAFDFCFILVFIFHEQHCIFNCLLCLMVHCNLKYLPPNNQTKVQKLFPI